jgi:hypothetical protein
MTFRKRRTVKRAALGLLLLTLFACETARPRPARAVDTGVIVISAIAGYVAFIVGGTWLVFTRKHRHQQPFMPHAELSEHDRRMPGGIRFGPDCRSPDGTVPTLCW